MLYKNVKKFPASNTYNILHYQWQRLIQDEFYCSVVINMFTENIETICYTFFMYHKKHNNQTRSFCNDRCNCCTIETHFGQTKMPIYKCIIKCNIGKGLS